MKNILLVIVLGALGSAAVASHAGSVGALATFGDNVADPGNIPEILAAGNAAGLGPVDTNFPPSPPYAGNRFSNGPVAVEYLADLLGLPDAAVAHRGVGNAFSGQLPVDLAGGVLIGNGSAIPGPIGRGLFALNETDVTRQVADFVTDAGMISADALMVVYASANDGALALNTSALLALPPDAAAATIQAGAQVNAINTAAAARTLIDAGARQVMLVLLPDIGRTPAAMAGGLAGSAAGTAFSTITNGVLLTEAARLGSETGADVSVFDSFSLLADIVARPDRYGLENVMAPCLSTPDCLADPAVADRFLFWDEFFPTTAVHAITAAAMADTIIAPRTLAAQAEVSRLAATRFAEGLLLQRPTGRGVRVGFERSEWRRESDALALGYEADLDQLSLSLQLPIDEDLRVLLAVAADRGDVDLRGPDAGFELESYRVGLAINQRSYGFEIDLAAAWSREDVDDIARVTGVARQVARASTRGNSLVLLGQLSRPTAFGDWLLVPQVRLGRGESELDGYREAGAVALEQVVDDRESESTYGELGVRVELADTEARWRPTAGVYWHTDLSDDDQEIAVSLATAEQVTRRFDVGLPDDDYVRLDAGVTWRLREAIDVRVDAGWLDGDAIEAWHAGVALTWRW